MPSTSSALASDALRTFATQVHADAELGKRIASGPEDQLKASVKTFVREIGDMLAMKVSILSESPVTDVGRPDLAIAVDGLLVGYIELKAPGEGTTDRNFRGRNLVQLKKFKALPNLIYTDARDWTFYREGQRERAHDVRLGAIDENGAKGLEEADGGDLRELFREFLVWKPIVPRRPRELAAQLAPLTKMVRTDVEAAAQKANSALASIYADWQRTLFPEASPDEFADSYAQTLTYGLLLAKLSGATTLDTHSAAQAIQQHSTLLAQTLRILTQPGTREELGPGLQLLERTIEAVDPAAIRSDGEDPWLYFYEDFLAEYDSTLRNERGVYYTPAQVVKAQVTLVDDLLRNRLGKPLGVADEDVTVLDPAVGTGTYLLRTLQQGVDNAMKQLGPGMAGSTATRMARNLYGFELLVGPYAVAHLRLTQAVQEAGGREPDDGVHIYLTDTLESPNELTTLPHSYFEAELAEEHRRAREVKQKTPILVCIGNPPYDRELYDSGEEIQDRKGGWVRFGDRTTPTPPIETFLAPAREFGEGANIRSVYNDYVYFWRWALWKVFEKKTGPGIVSFITGASYLRGPGFVGMRQEMRKTFDELWIIDLEGDSRGTRSTENVFAIRAPVAIAIGVRHSDGSHDTPARVMYTKITGSRGTKLSALETLNSFSDLNWAPVSVTWTAPFSAEGSGDYFSWPLLQNVFPWSHPGVQFVRTWPIAFDAPTLKARWFALLSSSSRATALRESRDRKVSRQYPSVTDGTALAALSQVSEQDQMPAVTPYLFRSFDRQFALLDGRLGDYLRPQLVRSSSDQQLFLTSLLGTTVLGNGPGIFVSGRLPDLHHFRGSYGGKDVMPLYRDAEAKEPNITHGLLDRLNDTYSITITPEVIAAYISGVLGHPGYTGRFRDELEVPSPRVPFTKDGALFQQAVELGKQVTAYQTYADRFPESIGASKGQVPGGSARVKVDIPDDPDRYPQNLRSVRYDDNARALHVGEGVIEHVDPRIWAYEVSGLHVVRSWLGYRMRKRSGRSSSPLDDIRPERWTWDMTKELLELLWVLEGVIALEPAQAALLDEIVDGELFLADEFPTPTDAERKAPKVERQQQLGLGDAFGGELR